MDSLTYWGLFLFASVLAYVLGYHDGKRRFSKTVYVSEWPGFSMQCEEYLSQAQIIAVLDKVRAHILENPLAQPKKAQAQSAANQASDSKEQAND